MALYALTQVIQRQQLTIGAKVLFERSSQLRAPIIFWLQAAAEEAKDGRLLEEFKSADHLAVIMEPLKAIGCVNEVRHRKDAPWNGQAQ